MVDAFTISLELVYQDLIAGEQLNLFSVNVEQECEVVRQALRLFKMSHALHMKTTHLHCYHLHRL